MNNAIIQCCYCKANTLQGQIGFHNVVVDTTKPTLIAYGCDTCSDYMNRRVVVKDFKQHTK